MTKNPKTIDLHSLDPEEVGENMVDAIRNINSDSPEGASGSGESPRIKFMRLILGFFHSPDVPYKKFTINFDFCQENRGPCHSEFFMF